MLGGNPVPWLLSSDEPAARWVTLTAVLDRELTDPAVLEARQQVVADIHTLKLVERLPEWASGARLSGHDSPGIRAPSAQPACRPGSPEWHPISPPLRRGTLGHVCPIRSLAGAALVASPTSVRW
jgi:hypothetical protein